MADGGGSIGRGDSRRLADARGRIRHGVRCPAPGGGRIRHGVRCPIPRLSTVQEHEFAAEIAQCVFAFASPNGVLSVRRVCGLALAGALEVDFGAGPGCARSSRAFGGCTGDALASSAVGASAGWLGFPGAFDRCPGFAGTFACSLKFACALAGFAFDGCFAA